MAKKKVDPLHLADEATRAMSKEIPDLEGAELKV